MAWVEDRWMVKVKNDDGSTRQERSSRHGDGLRYRVRYETADGAEKARSFERKGDADAFRDKVAGDLRSGTYLDPDAGKISLRKYAEGWLEIQTSDENSMVNIRFRVRHITAGRLGDMRLDQLAGSPSAVQAWIRGLKLAPYSVRQCFVTLSSICGAAVEDGRMNRNPCRARSGITLPKMNDRKVVPLELPVVAALREALPPRFRAMIEAGASCGERQGEIFGLAEGDIDFLRQKVAVSRQVKLIAGKPCFALPKGLKTRTVPLPPAAGLALSAHIAEFGTAEVTLPWHEPGDKRHGKPVTAKLMFTRPAAGGALIRQNFNNQVWKPALRRAGIEVTQENGMHVMRHTFASMLIHGGIDIKRVAAYMGHENPGFTLKVYGHLIEGGEEQARQVLDFSWTVPSPDSAKIV